MKKIISMMCLLVSSTYANDIYLTPGEMVRLNNVTVSCVSSLPQNSTALCRSMRNMSKENLFYRARTVGVGGCFIFNNGDYYAVMDSSGTQISMTYKCKDTYGGYCEAPVNGLIQLTCELGKCRD
jgi:hypothetical protein